jgi:hypothetical protein
MMIEPIVEIKIAETAIRWLEYDSYGSEMKAINAVLNRRGMEQLDKVSAKKLLAIAIDILNNTKKFRSNLVSSFGKSGITELTVDEYEDGRNRIRLLLEEKFPSSGVTIDIMIRMLWDMHYLR